MTNSRNNRDVERRLGQQYAQMLKECSHNPSVYADCKDVINASLNVMEHYNRLSLAIKQKMTKPQEKASAFFAS